MDAINTTRLALYFFLTEGLPEFIVGLSEIAIVTMVICLTATPFIKRLIKYAIEEYNKNKKE